MAPCGMAKRWVASAPSSWPLTLCTTRLAVGLDAHLALHRVGGALALGFAGSACAAPGLRATTVKVTPLTDLAATRTVWAAPPASLNQLPG